MMLTVLCWSIIWVSADELADIRAELRSLRKEVGALKKEVGELKEVNADQVAAAAVTAARLLALENPTGTMRSEEDLKKVVNNRRRLTPSSTSAKLAFDGSQMTLDAPLNVSGGIEAASVYTTGDGVVAGDLTISGTLTVGGDAVTGGGGDWGNPFVVFDSSGSYTTAYALVGFSQFGFNNANWGQPAEFSGGYYTAAVAGVYLFGFHLTCTGSCAAGFYEIVYRCVRAHDADIKSQGHEVMPLSRWGSTMYLRYCFQEYSLCMHFVWFVYVHSGHVIIKLSSYLYSSSSFHKQSGQLGSELLP